VGAESVRLRWLTVEYRPPGARRPAARTSCAGRGSAVRDLGRRVSRRRVPPTRRHRRTAAAFPTHDDTAAYSAGTGFAAVPPAGGRPRRES